MTLKIKDIQAPVASEMADFEKKFRQSMKSNVMLLDKIMTYIVKRKGKQMRPLFVFLSASTTGAVSEASYRGASLIELLHTATLVHDDVVDDAAYRRGFFSINALWKNKIAVLVGDFLLSRGMLLSIDHEDFDLLKIVSEAIRKMSEGELLQIEKTKKLNITENIYYDIIRQKTASLIKACCSVGAASTGADPIIVQTMGEFGEKVGMAFQIKDDLFDYGTRAIGKPLGIDIREKKMTLPLIYALSQVSKSEKNDIIHTIKKHSENTKKVNEVIHFVKEKQGLAYAIDMMNKYHQEAVNMLMTFPLSVARKSLQDLVQYTIERNR